MLITQSALDQPPPPLVGTPAIVCIKISTCKLVVGLSIYLRKYSYTSVNRINFPTEDLKHKNYIVFTVILHILIF